MTEPRSPDDELIIELTEVVEPSATGDDDIIELTDVVTSASTEQEDIIDLTEVVASSSAAEDEPIELTEVVAPSPAAEDEPIELTEVVAPSPAAQDEPIELTEVVAPSPAAEDELIELTEMVAPSPAVEDVPIELTEVVETPPSADEVGITRVATNDTPPTEEDIIDLVEAVDASTEAVVAVPDEPATVAADLDGPGVDEPAAPFEIAEDRTPENVAASEAPVFDLFDESALDETDALVSPDTELDFAPMDLDIEESKSEDLFDSLGMKLEPDLQHSEDPDELDFNLSTQELSDAIDLLDAKLAEEPSGDGPVSLGPAEALPAAVSQAQVEKALENVIRKMYAEKIDLLLNEAIEKNVNAEIKRLKEQLLSDSPED